MEEEQAAAAVAAPEPEAPPPASDLAAAIGDEQADIDAILADLRRQAEAEATTEQEAPTEAAPATADAQPQQQQPPAVDPAAVAEYLKSQGYRVEAPAPPPDPIAALDAEMAQLIGSDEEYAAARRAALAPLPPMPADTDPDWQQKYDAHKAAVEARDRAVNDLTRLDLGRQAAQKARTWGWNAAMGRLGQSWAQLPETYALSPERAKRVTEPQSAADAVAAVVEQVTANYEARLAERERYWQGEVARAGSDRSAAGLRAMGAAPQPGAPSGGRPAPAALAALFSEKGMPSDDVIERAKRGELASLSL